MAVDLSSFLPEIESANEIQNAGSALYVGPLLSTQNGETGPTEYTITVDQSSTAPAQGDTTLDLAVTAGGATVTLRRGEKLHFSSEVVTLTADATLTATASTVAVEPLSATPVADTDTAITWALKRILSPVNLPLSLTDNFVNRKDLTFGLQGSEVQVGLMADINVQIIARVDDTAFYEIIYPAATSSQRVYANIVRSSGLHLVGAAHVSAPNTDGNIDEIERPTFNLKFQAPFWAPSRYASLETDQQTGLNEIMRLSGLLEYS